MPLDTTKVTASPEPSRRRATVTVAGVWGRPIGRSEFASNSSGLRQRGGRWDAQTLGDYLSDPAAFAPGTLMPDTGLKDAAVREELVKILQAISTQVE